MWTLLSLLPLPIELHSFTCVADITEMAYEPTVSTSGRQSCTEHGHQKGELQMIKLLSNTRTRSDGCHSPERARPSGLGACPVPDRPSLVKVHLSPVAPVIPCLLLTFGGMSTVLLLFLRHQIIVPTLYAAT